MTTPTPHSAGEAQTLHLVQPLIEIQGLTKHFPVRRGFFNRTVGQVQAVSDVSLTVYPGETLGVVGESGCGKSTLGRCILQLIRPTAGSVRLLGQELTTLSGHQLRPLRRQMQIVFQNPYSSLDPRMTIGDTLSEPFLIHRAASGQALRQQVDGLLDKVGLPRDAYDRFPHEFSGGQRQRVGIARALALNPKFIVADEPVSALDVSIQAQILNLLDDLKREMGLTYLFIAHNLSVVEYISDRVVVMYLGRVVEVAPAAALYERPLHPYTEALMDAVPVANPAEARARRAHRKLLEGDPPNPMNPPAGCAFHPRCPYAVERCRTEPPQLVDYGNGHLAACHLVPERYPTATATR
jgi:oligopeptide/dipeptide ABC transporter ATP-binding protein